MSIELDNTAISVLGGLLSGIAVTITGVIRHLYLAREAEREARLADRAMYTAEMLAAAKTLREEDARENAELRARLDAASAPPPSQRASLTRTRKQR